MQCSRVLLLLLWVATLLISLHLITVAGRMCYNISLDWC